LIPTIAEVMEEIERRLGTIDGLRTSSYKPSQVSPPWAWVQLPDIDYTQTFQGAVHRLVVPIVVVVASVTDRAQRTQLSCYLDPIGDRSILQAVGGPYGGGCFLVQRARSGSLLLAGAEYWASTIDVEVALA